MKDCTLRFFHRTAGNIMLYLQNFSLPIQLATINKTPELALTCITCFPVTYRQCMRPISALFTSCCWIKLYRRSHFYCRSFSRLFFINQLSISFVLHKEQRRRVSLFYRSCQINANKKRLSLRHRILAQTLRSLNLYIIPCQSLGRNL